MTSSQSERQTACQHTIETPELELEPKLELAADSERVVVVVVVVVVVSGEW